MPGVPARRPDVAVSLTFQAHQAVCEGGPLGAATAVSLQTTTTNRFTFHKITGRDGLNTAALRDGQKSVNRPVSVQVSPSYVSSFSSLRNVGSGRRKKIKKSETVFLFILKARKSKRVQP